MTQKDEIISTHFEKGKTLISVFMTIKTANHKPIVHGGVYQGHDESTLILFETTKKKMLYLSRCHISEIMVDGTTTGEKPGGGE